MHWLRILSVCGLMVSLYAIFVEYNVSQNSSYEALCDISPEMSCSRVLTSDYSHVFSKLGLIPKNGIFDHSNALYGALFYTILIFMASQSQQLRRFRSEILLLLSTLSMILSAYLSYVLCEILRDICVVCFATYSINLGIFISCLVDVWGLDSTNKYK